MSTGSPTQGRNEKQSGVLCVPSFSLCFSAVYFYTPSVLYISLRISLLLAINNSLSPSSSIVDPLGCMYLPSLTIRTIRPCLGNLMLTIAFPTALLLPGKIASISSELTVSYNSMSSGVIFFAFLGTVTFSQSATRWSVDPWNKTEVTEIKNTRGKMISALGIPAIIG